MDLSPGSSIEALLLDTRAEGERDAAVIRANAGREAYGARVGAFGSRADAAMARATASNISPAFSGFNTAPGTAAQFSDYWYRDWSGEGRQPTAPAPATSPWARRGDGIRPAGKARAF